MDLLAVEGAGANGTDRSGHLGHTAQSLGGTEDGGDDLQPMHAHIHQGTGTRLKEPAGIRIPELEVFGAAVGKIALGVIGIADGAVSDHLFCQRQVVAHGMDGDANELHALFLGQFDLFSQFFYAGCGGLLGDQMLAGTQYRHIDLMMGLDRGGIDGDIKITVFDELVNALIVVGDIKLFAGLDGARLHDIHRRNANGICLLGDVGQVLPIGKRSTADNGNLPFCRHDPFLLLLKNCFFYLHYNFLC